MNEKDQPKTVPFTIPDAMSGKYRITTRDGRPARIICTDARGKFPVIALFTAEAGHEYSGRFMMNGCEDDTQSGLDLILTEIPVWTLPEPPAGKQWHRHKLWKQEWLEDGERPLLENEPIQSGDKFFCELEYWITKESDTGEHAQDRHVPFKTRRPLPDESAWWDCESDLPAFCWIRAVGMNGHASLVVALHANGFHTWEEKAEDSLVLWSEIQKYEFSTDRVTWKLCAKGVK